MAFPAPETMFRLAPVLPAVAVTRDRTMALSAFIPTMNPVSSPVGGRGTFVFIVGFGKKDTPDVSAEVQSGYIVVPTVDTS